MRCEHCKGTHPKGNSWCPLYVEGTGIDFGDERKRR